MSESKKKPAFLPKIFRRFQKTLSSFINAIAETITTSVHIPEIAIGPIIGSLITSATTLIIGFLTISNIFSEQFLYRPLQIQDNNASYTLQLETYRQTILTNYLNQTTQLTLNYPLWQLQQNYNLLRANTQSALKELDGERKRYIIIFLKDNHLLTFNNNHRSSNLLENANLEEAKLNDLDLSFVNLSNTNLRKSNLNHANFHQANLLRTNLEDSSLINADLTGTNLEQANLNNVILTNSCYNIFTQFPLNFDPIKAKMNLIRPFHKCPFIVIEEEKKKTK
ncbi:pentapeptide repeat-containing protein [Cyanobacterium stanieri LEGE 03274]|uniref:Pentapeptide repeat-containing protein n=1 Tax=Cyanobacterium stanieri LEGE 03274 TaxID=1828756 RepID=A0ABR9V1L5_9CHRO|nr:pentapeptide repeat-containing protein [Cyanobacterium stanieri]MBE9221786.1 pentapeptide repeat-containing protein [Cyanobacterium stanieri LEGE 03274]